MGKKRKKKQNQKGLKLFLILLVVVLVVGVGVYTHFTYNSKYKDDVLSIEEAEIYLKESIPVLVGGSLNFENLLSINENLKVTYKSSNEAVINSSGLVVRPSYLSNDVDVELEISIEVIPDGALARIYYNILGGISKSFKIVVTVVKLEQTNAQKINQIIDQLYVPSITKEDLGLVNEIHVFENVSITWSSSNEGILKSNGVVVSTGEVVLTATITLGEDSDNISFPVEVIAEYEDILEVDENFESISLSSAYDTEDNVNNLKIKQSVLNTADENSFLRLRSPSNASIEYVNSSSGLKSLSFKYWAITSSAFSSDVYLYVQKSIDDGSTWNTFESIKIVDNDVHTVSLDLSTIENNVKIRILSYTTYATMFIAIDDLKLERRLNEDDVRNALSDILPNSLSSSYVFPKSTPFGGKVEYSSDNETVLSSNGVINRPKDSVVVKMTATITNVFGIFTFEYDINVVGTAYVTPVEVFFIDLGKYGDADNGESIYFKIGDIDILVDAGDNMNATKQAISEVIDANSNDKVLDYVIATHPDADHIGSMKHIFDTYDVLNVIYFEGTHTTGLYQTFVESINNESTLVSECTVLAAYNNVGGCSRVVELIPNVKIEFLNTGFYETSETNGRSIVFVLDAYTTRLLMTGDADNGSGRNLEATYMDSVGDIDILKIVHHGTREGTTLEFLNAVDPEYAIITSGNYFGNKHGHPTFEAINRTYQYDSNIEIFAVVGGDVEECSYTTSYKCEVTDRFVDRNGTIKLTIDSNGFIFKSEYNEAMIELSSTQYWKTHPFKEYEYAK